MIDWYQAALDDRSNQGACLDFATRFLAAPAEERATIREGWDHALRWAMPNPFRLACMNEGPGTPLERMRTCLLFDGLAFGVEDDRESIRAFAVVHNSCQLAGIDAHALFEEVAAAVGEPAAAALRAFTARAPEDQSLAAFMLSAVEDPGGGFALRAAW